MFSRDSSAYDTLTVFICQNKLFSLSLLNYIENKIIATILLQKVHLSPGEIF